MINNVIIIRLKANNPIRLSGWIISTAHEKLYAQRFQGNPVSILALIKSENAKAPEKTSTEDKFNFK